MLSSIKKILKDERGAYGGVELMFIVGIVVAIATVIMATFKAGLSTAADNVSTKVQDTITGAAPTTVP